MSIQALAGHIDSYFVGSGITTVATVASIAVQADGDVKDNNATALNDFYLDFQALSKTVGDLIQILRDRRLIPNP